MRSEACTHGSFDTQKLLQKDFLYTQAFTHRNFYTQKLLHTEAFTHKEFRWPWVFCDEWDVMIMFDVLVPIRTCDVIFKVVDLLFTSSFTKTGISSARN